MKAVIGLGFGDEGKGLVTSYLCRDNPEETLIVRFNGGHQAGHTVMIKDDHIDKRHVFSSFGSGTLRGSPTYWSKLCTFAPVAFRNEYISLKETHKIKPIIYVDNECPVVTPFDYYIQRLDENNLKHGTVGVGFGSTIRRHEIENYKVFVRDLFYPKLLDIKLDLIRKTHPELPADFEVLLTNFRSACSEVVHYITRTNETDMYGFTNLLFEGAQGLMLDQDYGFFPHVTRSSVRTRNIMKTGLTQDCSKAETYYVTRTYQTRHGNGPMTDERVLQLKNTEHETNVTGKYQGAFRTGFLDLDLLRYALEIDSQVRKNLVITCVDQTGEMIPVINKGVIQEMRLYTIASFLQVRFDTVWVSRDPYDTLERIA